MNGGHAPGDPFPVVRYHLHGIVERELVIADFAGSALRGAFGRALRAAVCVTGQPTCAGCGLLATCAYPEIFEPPPREVNGRRFSQMPSPWVIEPPAPGPFRARKGERFACTLVLIGAARAQLPLLLVAWRHALATDIGAQGRIHLTHATDEAGGVVLDLAQGRLREHAQEVVIPPPPPGLDEVELEFSTPLHFTRDGRNLPAAQLTAHDVLMALVRRMATFTELHVGMPLAVDFGALGAAAKAIEGHGEWHEQRWQRYSSRQQRAMPMGGALGRWRMRGELVPFWPFLYLGQWLHVGKQCSFGMGRYGLRVPTAAGEPASVRAEPRLPG